MICHREIARRYWHHGAAGGSSDSHSGLEVAWLHRQHMLLMGRRPAAEERSVSIHVALNHVTHYRYDRRVGLSPQVVRLRPAPHCRTPIVSYSLTRRAGRALHQLAAGPVRELPGAAGVPREDDASSRSPSTWWPRWRSTTRSTSSSSRRPRTFRFATSRALAHELAPYLVTEPLTPRLTACLEQHRRASKQRTIDFLVGDQPAAAAATSRYLIRMEPGVQTPEQTLEQRQRLVPRHRLAAGAGAAPSAGWRRASSRAT